MLTKPHYGWTEFKLEGISEYSLSYLNNIVFEWLDQAIHGLETLKPFCLEGFLEPNRFLCIVSYWNCHIITEYDDKEPLEDGDITSEYSHINMIQFCQALLEQLNLNKL